SIHHSGPEPVAVCHSSPAVGQSPAADYAKGQGSRVGRLVRAARRLPRSPPWADIVPLRGHRMDSVRSADPRGERDASYERSLRSLHQAMDLACTRQWLSGQPSAPGELEIQGLSESDLRLLDQILRSIKLNRVSASPSIISALYEAQQQNRPH